MGADEDTKKPEKWGFDLYPERREEYKPNFARNIWFGKSDVSEKLKCEKNVWNVVNKSPFVKLLMSAMEKSGCPIDLERHIVCETCDQSLLGGYDQTLNQIVVCQNVCINQNRVAGALEHEMVHMFDYCKNKIDFTNLSHVACAEIKAANMTSCSFFTSLSLPRKKFFSVAKTHQDCVKIKAAWSLRYARNISLDDAMIEVNKVFDKCYNDLEPLGRRPRRNGYDFHKAYRERHMYGY